MERIEGMSIGLNLDTLKLDSGLTDLKSKLSLVNSEMKANLSAFDKADKSLDKYQATLDGLNKKLEVQKAITEKAHKAYKKAVEEFGEGSKEADKAARAYNHQAAALNSLERNIDRTTTELRDLQKGQDNTGKGFINLEKRAESFGSTLTGIGDNIQGVGQTLSGTLTAPLLGFGALAGKSALDFDKAAGVIQAEIGATGKQAEKLQKTAEKLWKNGFGDDLESVAVKVAGVSKALGDLNDTDLSNVTKGLDLFEKRGWADQREALRAIKVLMEQYGMSATKALDYLTKGFQDNLDYSGEFLDSISEYSTYFAEMGLSADDMFAKFKAGAKTGAFQLDKIGDSMKEFTLRAKDGSKSSTEAFKALGLNAKDMTKQFNTGGDTAKKAFEKVVKAIQNTKNETKRNTAAVGLFGTQYEDLGEKAFDAMLLASEGLKDVEGATKRASDALQDNLGTRAQKVWREFITDLEPVGEVLVELAEDILPKVADTVSDAAQAFAGMSPDAQKTALAIGGIAAAAGPTLTVIGGVTQGIGGLMKVTGPLLGALGAGKGLTGILSRIPGPIGLAATAFGIGALAVKGLKDSTEKAKEVNLKHVESMVEQRKSLEELTGKYEALKEKNKLTNHELLLFRDIQDKLKTATSAKEIENLTKQADHLQNKSGLSNKELSEMLKLNDQLIEKVPTAGQAFSEQGNAIMTNTDDLKLANQALRENIALELEIQKTKAQAKLDENIRAQIRATEELNVKIKELNNEKIKASAKEYQLEQLKKKQQEAYAAGEKEIAKVMENDIRLLEFQIHRQKEVVGEVAEEVQGKQKAVEKSQQQVAKTQELFSELINVQLANAGINAKGAEGIKQLDAAISKTQTRISELNRIKQEQGGLNDKQQKELENLGKALGLYRNTKGEIKNIQSEQDTVNQKIEVGKRKSGEMSQILSESEVKNIKFTGDGFREAKIISDESSKNVLKEIEVTDYGKANLIHSKSEQDARKNVKVTDNGDNNKIQQQAEKKATKSVRLTLFNSIASLLPSYISMPIKWIAGKIPGFAKGTRNAPGGLTLVGEAGRELVNNNGKLFLADGPTLLNLPKGSSVMPNRDTETIFKKWSMPNFNLASREFATGGRINSDGLYRLSEAGWPEWIIPTDPARRTDAMKLLALAGKEVTGNKRPHQLPGVNLNTNETDDLKRLIDMFERFLDKAGNIGGINQSVTINSPAPTSPSENARQLKQTMRQWALEWGG